MSCTEEAISIICKADLPVAFSKSSANFLINDALVPNNTLNLFCCSSTSPACLVNLKTAAESIVKPNDTNNNLERRTENFASRAFDSLLVFLKPLWVSISDLLCCLFAAVVFLTEASSLVLPFETFSIVDCNSLSIFLTLGCPATSSSIRIFADFLALPESLYLLRALFLFLCLFIYLHLVFFSIGIFNCKRFINPTCRLLSI